MAIHEKRRKRDGVTVFVIDFRDQSGRRVRENAGTTRTQAKKKLEKRIGEVRAGTYANARVEKRKAKKAVGPTTDEFCAQFLRDYAAHQRSMFHAERVKMFLANFGGRRLRQITKAELDAYLAKRATERKASTVRRDRAALRVMFGMAVEWGVLDASPAVKLNAPPEPPHATRFLTRDEWLALEAAAPEWLRPVLKFALLTGFRLKEVTGLKWEDYDKRAGFVRLNGNNKTASVRTVGRATPVL